MSTLKKERLALGLTAILTLGIALWTTPVAHAGDDDLDALFALIQQLLDDMDDLLSQPPPPGTYEVGGASGGVQCDSDAASVTIYQSYEPAHVQQTARVGFNLAVASSSCPVVAEVRDSDGEIVGTYPPSNANGGEGGEGGSDEQVGWTGRPPRIALPVPHGGSLSVTCIDNGSCEFTVNGVGS
ncbi:MAG: hypothetical protein AAF533_25965 [Acidobacteriota bacterium]